jgi:hypothetical protein
MDLLAIESGYAHPRISAVSDPDLVSDRAMASPFSLPSLVSALVVCAPFVRSDTREQKEERKRETHKQKRARGRRRVSSELKITILLTNPTSE